MTPALLHRGWAMAEQTLAAAESERILVTHWFQTGVDDSVNADEHFGSDARTLRFLAVALPTLIEQLGARAAIVSVPWDVEGDPTLSVVAVGAGPRAAVQSRTLIRLQVGAGPPFWRLGGEVVDSPPEVREAVGAPST